MKTYVIPEGERKEMVEVSPESRVNISIVLPAFNEEEGLSNAVYELHKALTGLKLKDYRIVIADNGSSDKTPRIGETLQRGLPKTRFIRLERKGRGYALQTVWQAEEADILGYMDVDLSTDLRCLPGLLRPIIEGTHDISIGSRLHKESVVRRGLKRQLLSRSYNLLLRGLFRELSVKDAQCGFKAISKCAAVDLLPLVSNEQWFFDTELLLLAKARGWRVHEYPVRWNDDEGTTVRLFSTVLEDLAGILRMKRALRRPNNKYNPPWATTPVLSKK